MYGQRCHSAHTDPRTVLAFSAPHRSCIGSMAYPSHPTSSPTAETKNTGKKVSTSINGMYGSGSGSPAKIIIQYAKNIMAGIKKVMGIYHLFFLILL